MYWRMNLQIRYQEIGSVFNLRKNLYMVWSGWEGDKNGQQDIYIAKMKNPWTIDGERVRISSTVYDWERHGDLNDPNNPPHVNVNEGPQILKHKKKFYLIYSASGCWTENYSLRMLTFTGKKNLLDSSSWLKSPQPVFDQSPENGVYAPGHNSFLNPLMVKKTGYYIMLIQPRLKVVANFVHQGHNVLPGIKKEFRILANL